MRFSVNARTGAIVSGDGTSDLELVVRGRTKTERARQSARARVLSLPPRSP
jgi:hypothetical protein